uniref:Uncharacterized protein n=1 Tax=Glossina austeni TaxID=7395 RepID=A0A1A9UF79_GLOAU
MGLKEACETLLNAFIASVGSSNFKCAKPKLVKIKSRSVPIAALDAASAHILTYLCYLAANLNKSLRVKKTISLSRLAKRPLTSNFQQMRANGIDCSSSAIIVYTAYGTGNSSVGAQLARPCRATVGVVGEY